MAFDEWMTNPEVLELARTCMGRITFDPASNLVAQKYVRADKYCVSLEEIAHINGRYIHDEMHIPEGCLLDGLKQFWNGNVWCNPPYSAGNIDLFVDKALYEWDGSYREIDSGECVNQMLFLVNSATDAKWYHKLLNSASCTLLWKGRIKFWKIANGEALEKWEGEKSKAEGKGKVGNSPRYLNTLFYFGSGILRFKEAFKGKGTFLKTM